MLDWITRLLSPRLTAKLDALDARLLEMRTQLAIQQDRLEATQWHLEAIQQSLEACEIVEWLDNGRSMFSVNQEITFEVVDDDDMH